MRQKATCLLIFILISSVPAALAIPGIPHWFYGYIEVNGQPVPDNNILVAEIDGNTYTTVTEDGRYGYDPNTFYVEDPEGNLAGEEITFYMGGKLVGSYVFENSGYTNLDFSVTTTCGDTYCLGAETCLSCPADCGVCTDAPVITINSPENKVYDTVKIDLDVSADQAIIVWMYSLNSGELKTFTPSIILTAEEGENNVTVVGINQVYQIGTSSVSFSVELPDTICGDGVCDAEESCSSCPQDCGTCDSGSPSGGNNEGPGGGGSGSTSGGNEEIPSGGEETPEVTTSTEPPAETTTTTPEEPSLISGLISLITLPNILIGLAFIVAAASFYFILNSKKIAKKA
jgi:hypothetical protein